MKIIINLIKGLLLIIFLVLITALFSSNEYKVERKLSIDQPVSNVFNFIKLMKNHNISWINKDFAKTIKTRGTDGELGCIRSYENSQKKINKVEQEIIKIDESKGIGFELRIYKKNITKIKMFLGTKKIDDNTTELLWEIKSSFPFPSNIVLCFLNMDTIFGKDLDIALKEIKNKLENDALEKTP